MKIKKRTLKLVFLIIIVIVGLLLLRHLTQAKEAYKFSYGLFSYSQYRGSPKFQVISQNSTANYTLTELALESRDATLSAYYLRPQSAKAAIVLLAGARVDKQGQLDFAKMLASNGYAVIFYDQRGLGKTVVRQDYPEPEQHKAVYDALVASDFLRSEKISPIFLGGESLGGRTAILAASIDDRVSGVLAISTSGYGLVSDPLYYSINPDNYLNGLGGRRIAFIHSTADTVIPLLYAQQTFQIALGPKKFYTINGCTHGYCPDMKESILEALDWMQSP